MSLKKYVSMDEYLMGRVTLGELSPELVANANTIVPRVNMLLDAFGEYRSVSSGYRRPEDNKKAGGAKLSNHMICAACDLVDVDGKLDAFCMANLQLLKNIGLWLEHPDSTPTWTHVQCVAPKSLNRVFKP